MGVLDECHCNLELENGVHLELNSEILGIEDAVRVLLQGLGEDINREGLCKTPLRVAKALGEGTRGDSSFSFSIHFSALHQFYIVF